ncbi:MAG: type IIL restriction-modification enzyme MmeI [Acidobacteriota bacterium]
MTVWIGYLQWISANGFGLPHDPVLESLERHFLCRDAILDLGDPDHPKEPEWPEADCIVGNPPFLGGKILRRELGDSYVDRLFALWDGRVPREADLCAYWFEKARDQVEAGRCRRADLLATQGIRGGANRKVLERIKETGEIFFAESDRPWILDGANVHVSMVGFDRGEETARLLDGKAVPVIHANLTAAADTTQAARLPENRGLAYMGDTKRGPFDIPEARALDWLQRPNPHGRPNSDVVVPWVNGLDVTGRPRSLWIVDFGAAIAEEAAARYEAPFEYVRERVKPERDKSRSTVGIWWQHERARLDMREALANVPRFLSTVAVSKHRLFTWMRSPTLPDHQVFAFAGSDDYLFALLHSRFHEAWALKLGTRLETRPRYTPTTCFETFPFPWPPGHEPAEDPRVRAIADAARELNRLREGWLNPPEWTREEILTFPGSAEGPWGRFVTEPDARGIGTVRYPRLVPRDEASAVALKARTLTGLYNQRPTWLANAHQTLDAAVAAAYAWPPDLPDEQILQRLLALNRERAGKSV